MLVVVEVVVAVVLAIFIGLVIAVNYRLVGSFAVLVNAMYSGLVLEKLPMAL